MSKRGRQNKTSQQIKEEQITFLLENKEKNLDEYKRAPELKEKQLSDAKKILTSAKKSYDKTVAENKELKIYIENIKQHFFQYNSGSKLNFQKTKKNTLRKDLKKKYKKVVYEEEPNSEPELEEEEQSAEEIEEEPEIKKTRKKAEKIKNNIFNYINNDAKRHKC